MNLIERYFKTDNIKMDIVWLLPEWMIYWAGIRLLAKATTGKYGDTEPTSIDIVEILNRWEEKDEPEDVV